MGEAVVTATAARAAAQDQADGFIVGYGSHSSFKSRWYRKRRVRRTDLDQRGRHVCGATKSWVTNRRPAILKPISSPHTGAYSVCKNWPRLVTFGVSNYG